MLLQGDEIVLMLKNSKAFYDFLNLKERIQACLQYELLLSLFIFFWRSFYNILVLGQGAILVQIVYQKYFACSTWRDLLFNFDKWSRILFSNNQRLLQIFLELCTIS